MTLINFYCIGFPSFVLALEPNNARVRGSFLSNVLKRAIPAALGVLATAILCICSAGVFGFGQDLLSTMCLITTCAVGLCLIWRMIWRISVPFTPLRRAVFVFVVCGLVAAITLLPGFFSVGRLTVWSAILTATFSALGCLAFYRLADFFEMSPERTTKLATGFGRGVRVSVRGRGRSKRSRVSSTGSAVRRGVDGIRARVEKRAAARELLRAQEHAEHGVAAAGASGSDAATAGSGARGERPQSAAKRAYVRKKLYLDEPANGDIRVKMHKTTRKKDQ